MSSLFSHSLRKQRNPPFKKRKKAIQEEKDNIRRYCPPANHKGNTKTCKERRAGSSDFVWLLVLKDWGWVLYFFPNVLSCDLCVELFWLGKMMHANFAEGMDRYVDECKYVVVVRLCVHHMVSECVKHVSGHFLHHCVWQRCSDSLFRVA